MATAHDGSDSAARETGDTTPTPDPSAEPDRPRSRRGYLLDMPLDGGSGWSTGAYAIVARPAAQPPSINGTPYQPPTPAHQTPPSQAAPNQAAPNQAPRGRFTTNPSQPPVAPAPGLDSAVDNTLADPPDQRRWTRRLALTGLVVLVAGLAVGLVAIWPSPTRVATSEQRGADGARAGVGAAAGTAVATPTAPGGVSTPGSGSTATTPSPTGSAVLTPPSLASGVHRAGLVRVGVVAGRGDVGFDFDAGRESTPDPAQADIVADTVGLKAVNGAAFAALVPPATPSAELCRAVPAERWTTSLVLAALLPDAATCVRTSDGRTGAFLVRQPQALVNGFVYTVYLDYTVWTTA